MTFLIVKKICLVILKMLPICSNPMMYLFNPSYHSSSVCRYTIRPAGRILYQSITSSLLDPILSILSNRLDSVLSIKSSQPAGQLAGCYTLVQDTSGWMLYQWPWVGRLSHVWLASYSNWHYIKNIFQYKFLLWVGYHNRFSSDC